MQERRTSLPLVMQPGQEQAGLAAHATVAGRNRSNRLRKCPCCRMLLTMMVALDMSSKAPTFNATFYSVAATVIPVLFLAIAVQGTLYIELIKNSNDRMSRLYRRLPQVIRPQLKDLNTNSRMVRVKAGLIIGLGALTLLTATLLPACVAIVILGWGIIGEIDSLISLYWQRDVGLSYGPLLSMIFLMVIVGGTPTVLIVRFWRSLPRQIDHFAKVMTDTLHEESPSQEDSAKSDATENAEDEHADAGDSTS